ncbi:DUF3137 domain-containing protein [Rheinheimera sp.]|uniref:DUF3137 domain-containing protein n=1 Tax=Rheinheimera sp. TaxID=1869214 RepID=UPI004048BBF9
MLPSQQDPAPVRQLEQSCENDIAELEQLRQRLVQSAWPLRTIAIPGLLGYVVVCLLLFPINQLLNLLLITVLTSLIVLFSVTKEAMLPHFLAFSDRFRHSFVPAIAKAYDDIDYQQDGKIDPHQFTTRLHFGDNKLHLGRTVSHTEQADYFRGNHRGCEWELVHTRLTNAKHEQLFCGQLLLLTLPRSFAGVTTLNMPCTASGAARVHLEQSAFSEVFIVASTDQVAARSWLTPAVMDRLEQLNSLFDGLIRAQLTGNSLLLLLPATQLIALPSIDEPVASSLVNLAFVAQLQSLYQLFDTLLVQFPETSA